MKHISNVELYPGSKEELLPGFTKEFPYIASYCELDKYTGRFAPWHWHKAVELFYVKSGSVEYDTPREKLVFPSGSGGMVNSNVLHMTRTNRDLEDNIQLLHIFDPSFIAGSPGSLIENKYVTPLTASSMEILPLFPDNPEQAGLLDKIRESFFLSERDSGYEIKLRSVLSEIWLQLFSFALPLLEEMGKKNPVNDKIKLMMVYIHEHYAEKISVSDIACAAFSSERECFRVFHEFLHTTPVEYMKSYRLQMACHMLKESHQPVTFISQSCGLGSSSYFGKAFREYFGCTPMEYRRRWQDSDR